MKFSPHLNFLLQISLVMSGIVGSLNASTTENFLTLGSDQLYYEISGEGFPLVLVSGGSGMDLRQWDKIIQPLRQEHRVVRYDPRGIGRSDNPTARYSDAADFKQLLDHLGLNQVVVIGLSSAGGTVLEFALQFPDRITGVVAAAPFVPGFEFSEAMMARLQVFNQASQQGREAFLDQMFKDPHFFPAPIDRSVRVAARQIMAYNFDKGGDFDQSLPIALEPPLIKQLPQIESPVLLLAGELDHTEVLRRNQFLSEKISSAIEQVIPNSGHNIPLENPEAFLKAVMVFLQKVDN